MELREYYNGQLSEARLIDLEGLHAEAESWTIEEISDKLKDFKNYHSTRKNQKIIDERILIYQYYLKWRKTLEKPRTSKK